MRIFKANLIIHKGQPRIAVRFEKKSELINRFKKLEGSKWSSSKKTWHLPDTEKYRSMFRISETQQKTLSLETIQKIESYKRYLRTQRYSENTIKVYSETLKVFLSFHHQKSIQEINNEDVIHFNDEYLIKRKLSAAYQNQLVNGLKLFYCEIENRSLNIDSLQRPIRERKLPRVLSKEEVKSILEALSNIKHLTMLSLIYACGLRSGELLSLKPTDIDSKRMIITIHQSKGKKDRIVPISDKIVEMLRTYYIKYRPNFYLFEGIKPGTKYSPKSLQLVLKKSLKIAKIAKPVTLHWLRYSYATHILENGTDLRLIQELLGHNSSKTTEIYTHVSTKSIKNVKSPFDDL